MNETQKHMLNMIEDGLVIIDPKNKDQLKSFALACFSASEYKNGDKLNPTEDRLKKFSMQKSKAVAISKIKSDGSKSVFVSRVVGYLTGRKYFNDFSTKLNVHPKELAQEVLSELKDEGILEFSENQKRVSIKWLT